MRVQLKQYLGKSIWAEGTFLRYGKKEGPGADWNTAILTDIKVNGQEVTDHLWFVMARQWLHTELVEGTVVKVQGIVYQYRRTNGSKDFGIENVTSLEVLHRPEGAMLKASKVWEAEGSTWMKFLTSTGPRWFQIDKEEIKELQFHMLGGKFVKEYTNEPVEEEFVKIIQYNLEEEMQNA